MLVHRHLLIVVIHKIELLTKKKRTKKRKVIVVVFLTKVIQGKPKGLFAFFWV
jgi:hypothetical protein